MEADRLNSWVTCLNWRSVLAWSVFTMLAWPCVVMAGGDDAPFAASNQGVALSESLDGAEPDSSNDAPEVPGVTGAVPPENEAVAGDGVDHHLETRDGREPETVQSAARRTIRRRSPASTVRPLVAPRSVPWYRSGFGALFIVLLVLAVALWAVRRWVPAARSADRGQLEILGRVSLTPKHQVVIVKVGLRCIVVGVSPDRLSRLSEIDDAAEVAGLAAHSIQSVNRAGKPFDDLLVDEAATFVESEEQSSRVQTERPGRSNRSSQPLGDLLNRLRDLQHK